MKKYFLIAMLISATPLIGCETVKGTVNGAGTGIGKDIDNTKKNVQEIPPAVNRLDQWMQKNMW